MIILGIDPGYRRIGYGLIKKHSDSLELIAADLVKISQTENTRAIIETRDQIRFLIKRYNPKILAIEKLFFSKNQKTALLVAETKGVILSCATEKGITIQEYSPNEVKLAITGYGFADKQSVAKMIRLILKRPDLKVIDDVSDAIALAITAINRKLS